MSTRKGDAIGAAFVWHSGKCRTNPRELRSSTLGLSPHFLYCNYKVMSEFYETYLSHIKPYQIKASPIDYYAHPRKHDTYSCSRLLDETGHLTDRGPVCNKPRSCASYSIYAKDLRDSIENFIILDSQCLGPLGISRGLHILTCTRISIGTILYPDLVRQLARDWKQL